MNAEAASPVYDTTSLPPLRRRLEALAGAGFRLIALVHILVALSFLIVLAYACSSAHAEEVLPPPAGQSTGSAACDGRNLLKAMAESNPAKLAQIRSKAAEVPNGEGRLWKVEAPDTASSWLYGTMHVTDPRVLDLPTQASTALSKADTVVIETTDILDPAKAQAEILAKPDLTMFTDGKTLASFLDPQDLALVKAKLEERGIAFGLVSRMKPWMIASLLAMPACEAARKDAGTEVLDKKIAEEAKAKGKDVEGLETLDEQFEALASLPMKFHIRGLVESLELGDLLDDVSATMTDLYLKGEIGMILPMMEAVSPKEDQAPGSGYAAFQERIITDRNAVMAKRAAPMIDRGNAFIAIGALHLPGNKGVVALLRRAGYTVTAVD